MNNDVAFIPERLRELRRKDGSTQEVFGNKIGCTKASVSAYENGSKIPPTQTLVNIAKVCDCSIDWLFGIKKAPSRENRFDPFGEKEKYSDYFAKLLSLGESPFVKPTIGRETKEAHKNVSTRFSDEIAVIRFEDPVIKVFIKAWHDIRKLYLNKIIDLTVYNAWAEKAMRDFDFHPLDLDIDKTLKYESCLEWLTKHCNFSEYEATLNLLGVIQQSGEVPTLDEIQKRFPFVVVRH